MNCLVIHGSPRRGNTWDVLNKVKNEMDERGIFKWDFVELGKEKIPNCLGCFNCIIRGEEKCPHKGYMENIINKMEWADIFIVTSPVYSMNITGTLKTFIDHMSFKFHRPSYFKKKALVITTTAGAGHKYSANYIKSVLEYWGVNYIETLALAYGGIELNEKNIKTIETVSKRFVEEVNRNQPKKAKLKSVFMYNAWKAMSMNLESDSADYIYWDNEEMKNNIYGKEIPVAVVPKLCGYMGYAIMKKVTRKNK